MLRRNLQAPVVNQRGFTLLESVIAMVMVAIMITAIVSLFAGNILSLHLGKSRSVGLALASERLEYLRDLPYDSLATQSGDIYPAGSIQDNQDFQRDNINFRVNIRIKFVDDPFDGNLDGTVPNKPVDLYSYDYKQAEIKVYTKIDNRLVASLSTTIAGKAAETASNTGIIRVKVLDANGEPVDNARVVITNPNLNPAVNIDTITDANGLLVIPKLPPDSSHRYKIAVSKSGYSSEETLPDPAGPQTPVMINPNVLAQQITDLTFTIDHTSTLNITAVDTNGAPVNNLPITVNGSKLIYTSPNQPKISANANTNGSGQATFGSIEWDSFSISVPNGYYIASVSPYQPVAVDPGSVQDVRVVVTTNASWPRVSLVAPINETSGNSAATLTINGANLSAASVRLVKSGSSDIIGSISDNTSSSITAVFNLTGAASGQWDIKVNTPAGEIIQTGGLNVAP